MTVRWHCRLCRKYGVGGPEAAVKHLESKHADPPPGASAQVELFGFAPQDPERWKAE